MRFDSLPSSLLSLLTVTLLRPVSAGLMVDLLDSLEDLQNFAKRCENPCGYYGQLCCLSGESCYTDTSGQAQCGAASAITQAAGGDWEYYTTTYVQTDLQTVTETFSSFLGATTPTTTALSCSYAQGQTPCGNMCCNSGQYCQQAGMCVAVPGSSGYYSSLATVTVTSSASAGAPLRPTTNTVTTTTSTGTAASTVPYQTPVGTNGAILTGDPQAQSSGGGLSGGAIAGIVIGVIAGIILLLLLCACCCFKGLLDGLLAIFGLGPRRRRRREEVEIIEERHHHGHGGAAAAGGRTWYGAQRPTGSHYEEKRKSSGIGGFGKAAIFLGGMAAILGLKRRHDKKDNKSESGYSYYDSEYYTSSSKLSLRSNQEAFANNFTGSSSSAGRTRASRSRSRSRI